MRKNLLLDMKRLRNDAPLTVDQRMVLVEAEIAIRSLLDAGGALANAAERAIEQAGRSAYGLDLDHAVVEFRNVGSEW